MLAQQVLRTLDTINADLTGTDVVPVLAPLEWPRLFSLQFVGPGLAYRFTLDGKQIRSLYAQLHVRLVVAPQCDKLLGHDSIRRFRAAPSPAAR